ncbi:hypothetical protein [Paenibacillus thermotolerans]|uniref:hypothetical protein n=1 Tax=Paenibacillus thermotolerans TaxID=3027807 RepID=UPI0023679937|nr:MULTISPECIES: hypothetical protein [unclassified Paenibacillus]
MTERDRGGKRPSKSFNEQQNMAEFGDESITLQPNKAKEYAPSLNNISKKSTE